MHKRGSLIISSFAEDGRGFAHLTKNFLYIIFVESAFLKAEGAVSLRQPPSDYN